MDKLDTLDTRRAADPIAAVAGTGGARDPDGGLAVSTRRRVLTLGLAAGLGGLAARPVAALPQGRQAQRRRERQLLSLL